jgi:alpha-tubulin suppressor-like RCC1 family protein
MTKVSFFLSRFTCLILAATWFQVPLARASDTVATSDGFAAVITNGVLVTWGKNESGQLGHSAGVSPVSIPTLVSGTWQKVSLGNAFTIAQDNSGQLFSWGVNDFGQLGSGSVATQSATPLRVAALAPSVVATDFVAGASHALALGNNGKVYTWGRNGLGQLGTRDVSSRSVPVQIKISRIPGSDLSVRAIAATDNSSFAIATDGTLWAWGSNASGELGTASKLFVNSTPVQVGKSAGWTALYTGSRHVIGILNGKPYVWGDNSVGQLGTGKSGRAVMTPTALKLVPLKGTKLPVFVKYSAGDYQSFAFTADGTLYAWGNNMMGQLGVQPVGQGNNSVFFPTRVSATEKYDQISSGAFFTLLHTTASSATPTTYFSVGTNVSGELGTGTVLNDRGSGVPAKPIIGVANLSVAAPALISEVTTNGVPTYGTGTSMGALNLVVQNRGSGSYAGEYTVAYYLSVDPTLDASDRLLATHTVSTVSAPLAPAGARGEEFISSELNIPDVIPGAYYLLSQVVPTGVDTYSPDNGAATPLVVKGPDLQVAASAGQVLGLNLPTVSATLRNLGLGVIPAGKNISYEVYLSLDAVLAPAQGGDVLLKSGVYTVPAGGFGPGANEEVVIGDVSIPANTTGGNYYALVVLNRQGGIAENDFTNNLVAIPILLPTSDLAVSSITLPVEGLGSSSTVTLATTVSNEGALPYTGNYTVKFYLSDDAIFDYLDLELGAWNSPSAGLTAGQKIRASVSAFIPKSSIGTRYVIARVVSSDGVSDRIPSNNFSSTAVLISPPKLEINKDAISGLNASVQTGGNLGPLTVDIQNTGVGVIGAGRPISVSIYLSIDSTLSSNDYKLETLPAYTGGLTAGQVVSLTTATSLATTGIPNGIYNLLIVANGDNGIAETNSALVSLPVSIGSVDVGITAPSLGQSVLGTNTVISSIDVVLNNDGSFDVPAGAVVDLLLSTDAVASLQDKVLQSKTLASVLPSGNSPVPVKFTNVAIPDGTPGAYYLIARVVLPNALNDSNIANNTAYEPVTLVRPHLTISGATSPAIIDLDSTLTLTGINLTGSNDTVAVIPASTAVSVAVYLSADKELQMDGDSPDTLLLSAPAVAPIAGIGAMEGFAFAGFNFQLDPNTKGGNAYLLFVVTVADATKVTNSDQRVVSARPIFLKKATNPGPAMDYGNVEFDVTGSDGKWLSVDDNRASEGSTYRSPELSPPTHTLPWVAKMAYTLIGPAEVRAPWKLISTGTGDTLSYTISGSAATASIISPLPSTTYDLPGGTPITVPAGLHTVTWIYTQNSTDPLNQARVDLDVPVYATAGDSSWYASSSEFTAKVGTTYARSPGGSPNSLSLAVGQQASLGVTVTGPALVRFWWRTRGTVDKDILSFAINGQPAQFPTTRMGETALPAQISGTGTDWTYVAFLVPAGPQALSWNYTQGSSDTTAFGAVDGLQVVTPIPLSSGFADYQPSTSLTTDSPYVPASNVDLAITAASTVAGTYLLDDATNGTSRLPLTVELSSVGSSLAASGISVVFNNEAFVGDIHSGARAEAVVSGGVVTSLFLLDGGYGYANGATPTVAISPPTPGAGSSSAQATASVVMASGVINECVVVDGGSGYTQVPTVTVNATPGTGAAIVARLGVRSISLAAPIAYASAPQVMIVNGGGTGAEASPVYENGLVTGLTVTAAGSGYTSVPEVWLNNVKRSEAIPRLAVVKLVNVDGGQDYTSTVGVTLAGGGGGTGGGLTAVSSGGPISSVSVAQAGSGYSMAPTASITGSGSGAVVRPRLGVNSAIVSSGGTGYTAAPIVSFIDPGAGATATATFNASPTVNPSGAVTGVSLGAGGSNYKAEPAVVFTGGGGRGAVAKAQINAGVVTGLNLVTGGAGYTSAPSVVVAPYKQAQAKAYLRIKSLEVVGSGAGYDPNQVQAVTPFVTVSPPADFVPPTVDVTVSGGVVTSAVVATQGSGAYYLDELDITWSAGSADFTAKGEIRQGRLVGVRITNPGTGYTNGIHTGLPVTPKSPVVTIVLTSDPVKGYVFQTATIVADGTAYSSPPILTVQVPDSRSPIQVTAALKPVYEVAGLEVADPGFGYQESPLITLEAPPSGTRAAITSLIDEGKVVSYEILDGGSGYAFSPRVTVAAPPELAAAVATIDGGGHVSDIIITNAGSGYETMPAVAFDSGAAAASVTGLLVSAEISSGGTGYSPTISFSGGSPTTAATATASVAVGKAVRRLDIINHGSGYTPTSFNPGGLEVRLSRNGIYGDGDDEVLGNYALQNLSSLPNGRSALLDLKLNLPFDLVTGDYNLMVTYRGFGTEFTLGNNYKMISGVHIERAPNLVLKDGGDYLSSVYPYHPEDAFYIDYTIQNTGLGTVTTAQPFKVGVQLMALPLEGDDPTAGTVILTYADKEVRAYLPEAGGAYPSGGEAPVFSFLDLPNERDILVALGLVPAGTPEDSAPVVTNRSKLAGFKFYFRLFIDSQNQVVESSETNVNYRSMYFSIVPVPKSENFAQYIGQSAFAGFFNGKPGLQAGVILAPGFDPENLTVGSTNSQQFTGYMWKYALYGDPGEVDRKVGLVDTVGGESAGHPNLLFQEGQSNGKSLIINRSTYKSYISLTSPVTTPYSGDIVISAANFTGSTYSGTISPLTPPVSGPFSGSITGSFTLGESPLPGVDSDTLLADTYTGPITFTSIKGGVTTPCSGTIKLGLGSIKYNTISFDFNARANDVEIDVFAVDVNGNALSGASEAIITLKPPYTATGGAQSLTGTGGLKDQPFVVAVEGNVTDSQKVYGSRITVRDSQPQSVRGATDKLVLKVRAKSGVAAAVAPTSVGVGNSVDGIVLRINGGSIGGGAFVIERTISGIDDYSIIGSTTSSTFTDVNVTGQIVYKYRVYGASVNGITAAVESPAIVRVSL